VRPPYIREMGEARPIIDALTSERDLARQKFFAHHNPGNLTPAQFKAWELEHHALKELLEAAQIRLDAEVEMHDLLYWESVDG
jgi:hypothetical protein